MRIVDCSFRHFIRIAIIFAALFYLTSCISANSDPFVGSYVGTEEFPMEDGGSSSMNIKIIINPNYTWTFEIGEDEWTGKEFEWKKLEDYHYQLTMDKNDIEASNTFLADKIDEYNYKFTLLDKNASIHGSSNVE